MDVEQQEYQTEESNLSRVGQRSDKPAAEPGQHHGDVEAHAGYDNRDGDKAQVAAAAAHGVALLNIHDHEMQDTQQQDEYEDDESEETYEETDNDERFDDDESASNYDDSDLDMERRERYIKLRSDMLSADAEARFQAVQTVCKLLKQRRKLRTDKLIKIGFVPVLAKCLTVDAQPQLQCEAAQSLIYLASRFTRNIRAIVKSGAIPLLARLLNSPDSDVCERAAKALGAIGGLNPQLRDQVIELGVVTSLANFINSERPVSLLHSAAWAIGNIGHKMESPLPATTLQEILPALYKLVQRPDLADLPDAIWAVAYIAGAGNDNIQMIVDLGFVKHLVPLLGRTEGHLQEPALLAVCNISSGTDSHRQAVLDEGALSYVPPFFMYWCNARIGKKAAMFLSNMVGGNREQVQAVIDANLIPLVAKCFRENGSPTQREAAKAISNLTTHAPDQVRYCVQQGVIPPLRLFVRCNTTKYVIVGLRTVRKILKVYADNKEELEMVKREIGDCGGLEAIERLRENADETTRKLACKLHSRYW